MEVVAHQHGARAERVHQELAREILGRKLGQLAGEGQDQHLLDAVGLHQGGALARGS